MPSKHFLLICKRRLRSFYWPVEKRELNQFGKPGKLHAKAAVIDKQALLSSANLTDDAFLRNLELGVLFVGGDMGRFYAGTLESLWEELLGNERSRCNPVNTEPRTTHPCEQGTTDHNHNQAPSQRLIG